MIVPSLGGFCENMDCWVKAVKATWKISYSINASTLLAPQANKAKFFACDAHKQDLEARFPKPVTNLIVPITPPSIWVCENDDCTNLHPMTKATWVLRAGLGSNLRSASKGKAESYACDKHKQDLEDRIPPEATIETVIQTAIEHEFTVGQVFTLKASNLKIRITSVSGSKVKFHVNGTESDAVDIKDLKARL